MGNETKVSLELNEVLMAATVGVMRRLASIKRNLKGTAGQPDDNRWQIDVEGACGEMAVAKALGIHWNGSINTFKRGGDVGDLQVRASQKHNNCLIVRSGDRDEDVFIFVTGLAPEYLVHGWIVGKDAKQEKYLKAPNGREAAFFVPREALRSVEEENDHF